MMMMTMMMIYDSIMRFDLVTPMESIFPHRYCGSGVTRGRTARVTPSRGDTRLKFIYFLWLNLVFFYIQSPKRINFSQVLPLEGVTRGDGKETTAK